MNTKLKATLLGALALTIFSGCETPSENNEKITKLSSQLEEAQKNFSQLEKNVKNTQVENQKIVNSLKSVQDSAIKAQVEKSVSEYFTNNSELLKNKTTEAEIKAAADAYFSQGNANLGKNIMDSVNAYQAEAKQKEEEAKAEKVKNVPDIREGDHVLGNKDSDLVLFEYSDYHCPFCKRFHPTTEKLAKEDNIAVVFRPMPLVHANTATVLHEVAECVADIEGNDAFWKFSAVLFEKGEAVNKDNYSDEFSALNITKTDEIKKCVADGTFKEKVQKSIQEGYSLGVNGTPASILKNIKTGKVQFINGAYPYEAVQEYAKELRK